MVIWMISSRHIYCLEWRNNHSFLVIRLPIHVPKLMMIEPHNAGMNPAISIPSRISPANHKSIALMTSMNKPNESNTIGRLINVNIGFTKVFKNPMISEAMMADIKFLTHMPSMINWVKYTAVAVIPHRIMSEIIANSFCFRQYTSSIQYSEV